MSRVRIPSPAPISKSDGTCEMSNASQPSIIRQSSIKAIKDVLSGGYPVVALETWEEDSSLTTLTGFFNSAFKGNGTFVVWDLL